MDTTITTKARKSLDKPVNLKKIEKSLEMYRKKEITIGKAAELAGVPLREMMSIAKKEEIPFQYSLSDLREDFRGAQK